MAKKLVSSMIKNWRAYALLAILACIVGAEVALNGIVYRRLRYMLTQTIVVDGLTFHLNPADKAITQWMVRDGEWEPAETAAIKRHLKPGDTFVDVGANIGFYTLVASRIVGPGGRVIAFEPDPESFALLKRNVERSGFKNITIEQKALSNEKGVLKLFLAAENKGDHRIYQPGGRDYVEVEALTLDEYLKGQKADFIKIDTQGAEGVIVEGLLKTLDSNPGVRLTLEFWPKGLTDFGYLPAKLLAFFEERGFKIQDIGEHNQTVEAADAAGLLARYSPANGRHTNLYLNR